MSSPPMTTEFQAILRAVIDHDEQRIAELKAELAAFKTTPQNSSLPRSIRMPDRRFRGRSPRRTGVDSRGTRDTSGRSSLLTLLNVIETCQQQNRNVLSNVTDTVHAHSNRKTCTLTLHRGMNGSQFFFNWLLISGLNCRVDCGPRPFFE